MTEGLSVFLAEREEDISEVHRLVERIYLASYGTVPKSAHAYGAVRRGDEVVACLGFDHAEPDGRFAIERIYSLDRSTYPVPVESKSTAQFGRLVSSEPCLGRLAVHTGIWFAVRSGKRLGIIEHTDTIHRVALGFGLVLIDIPVWEIDLSETLPGDRGYYEKREGKPYLMDLERSLERTAAKLPSDVLALFGE
ncbi:MAG TPA: hypothetical protein VGE53_02135 [Candidatus Paceibacterota bacterium]